MEDRMGREGQVVMITGAAGNLGRAVAAGFAADGAALVLLDVDGAALAAAYLGEQPRRLIRPTDLLQPDEVMRTTEAAIAAFGRIDVLCNIAGGFAMGPPVHETPPELWRRMLD